MRVDIETRRKLSRLLVKLSDELKATLLQELSSSEMEDGSVMVDFLDTQRKGEWTTKDYKTLWSYAELSHFFDTWVSPFKVEPTTITLAALRKRIKTTNSNDQLIILELSYDPKVYFVGRTPTSYRSLIDKTLTTDDIRDCVYWMPEYGLLVSALHEDLEGAQFKKDIIETLTGDWEEFRIRSLVITKLFNTDRWINELVVSADPQISGFDGLDDIRFTGPDVKRGLAGLYRRHDIRVYIHQIGPNIAIENEHLRLEVGNRIKIRSLEGIFELHMLTYPEEYPTEDHLKEVIAQFESIKEKEDQIMTLRREYYEEPEKATPQITNIENEITKMGTIKLRDLAKRWNLEQFRVEYTLTKAISNGLIKAKFVEDAIVKT
ncbi:MAG: hypothetical protein ACXAE3_08800 [Candidatus Kariarchaeaceae archaeon]|jgi:hypothetical protein